MAEGVGFEPTVPGGTTVFETKCDCGRPRVRERPLGERREWDLNPRCPEAQRFSRPSDSAALASLRASGYWPRRAAKNDANRAAASASRTPGRTGSSWLRRGSTHRL